MDEVQVSIQSTTRRGLMKPQRLAIVVVVLSLAVVGASASPARAEGGCGAVVTHNLRLTRDLLGCSGSGLVIGASNITINLNNHVVEGGILVNDGTAYNNIEIINGTIRNASLDGVLSAGDGSSICPCGLTIRNVSFINADIQVINASNVKIDHVSVTGNNHTGYAGDGILLYSVFNANVTGSHIYGNSSNGIETVQNWSGTFTNNKASSNGVAGIVIGVPNFGTVVSNTTNYNGFSGIAAYTHYSRLDLVTLTDNTMNHNGQWGFALGDTPDGTIPTNGGGNVARFNGQPAQCMVFVCITTGP